MIAPPVLGQAAFGRRQGWGRVGGTSGAPSGIGDAGPNGWVGGLVGHAPLAAGWAKWVAPSVQPGLAACGRPSRVGGGFDGGEPWYLEGCGCGGACSGDEEEAEVHYRVDPRSGGDGEAEGGIDKEDDGRIDVPFEFGDVPGPDDVPRDPGEDELDYGFDLRPGTALGMSAISLEQCYPALMKRVSSAAGAPFDATATAVPVGDPTGFTPDSSADACRPYGANEKEPVSARILLAVSPDGRSWTKTGEVVCNHAAVPCLAVEGGVLYLFFNVARDAVLDWSGSYMGRDNYRPTPLAVAFTTDLVTWTYRLIGDHRAGMTYVDPGGGGLARLQAMDPSVVRTKAPVGDAANDRWFLYFTLEDPDDPDRRPATYVAGARRLADMDWEQRNSGYEMFPLDAGEKSRDPNVLWMRTRGGGGEYQFFAGGNTMDVNWSAQLAANGWTILDKTEMDDGAGKSTTLCGGDEVMMCNPQDRRSAVGGSRTWYGFANVDPGGYVVAATVNEDGDIVAGTDATGGCTTVVTVDRSYEMDNIRDAAVVQFGDCWVMVYVTSIPKLYETSIPATS